jgi:hypothetical protein
MAFKPQTLKANALGSTFTIIDSMSVKRMQELHFMIAGVSHAT